MKRIYDENGKAMEQSRTSDVGAIAPGESDGGDVHLEDACPAPAGRLRRCLDDVHTSGGDEWSEDDGGDGTTREIPAPNVYDWLQEGDPGTQEGAAGDRRVALV